MKTLYLIDGYAQFFRAYHAIRTPMTSIGQEAFSWPGKDVSHLASKSSE